MRLSHLFSSPHAPRVSTQVPLKAMLAAYGHAFGVLNNYVSLHPSLCDGSTAQSDRQRPVPDGFAGQHSREGAGAGGGRGADGCDWMRVVAAAYVQVSLKSAP